LGKKKGKIYVKKVKNNVKKSEKQKIVNRKKMLLTAKSEKF